MNIIIVGAGEIGRHLAAELSAGGHRVSVVEKDAAVAAQLESHVDAKVIHGNGSSVSDLVEAGVGDCELMLAMTSSNTANLVACSMAKGLNVPMVVSRVHPGLQREEWLFDYRGHFRIDHIFSSERLAAIELAKHVRNPDGRDLIEIANGRIELQQVTVSQSSDAAGVSLRKLNPPGNVRVAMVKRGGRRVVPAADFELSWEDEVTVFGEPRKLRDVVHAGAHAGGEAVSDAGAPGGLRAGDFGKRPEDRDSCGGEPAVGDGGGDPAVHHLDALPYDQDVG